MVILNYDIVSKFKIFRNLASTGIPIGATNLAHLKEQCYEIFDLWFFHQTIPPGPLVHGLKNFLGIREEIQL
jgi:hypothetical protein